mgnify:FL=1
MRKMLKFLDIIFTIIMIIWDIIEFLAVPALFIIIGLLNSFPWQYYVITIGGYFLLFIIFEIVAHFVFKALNKKYSPILERKFEKYFNKFSQH